MPKTRYDITCCPHTIRHLTKPFWSQEEQDTLAVTRSNSCCSAVTILLSSIISATAGHRHAVSDGRLIEGYVHDMARLEEVFHTYEVHAVIHFASFATGGESVRDPLLYYHNNVAGTGSLCRPCIPPGCRG
ncbi:hypothetical protein NKDENANG_00803 [Candidatus Entotheonellaceae bacterium PAL068K]